jgi:hypothetical protein
VTLRPVDVTQHCAFSSGTRIKTVIRKVRKAVFTTSRNSPNTFEVARIQIQGTLN